MNEEIVKFLDEVENIKIGAINKDKEYARFSYK